MEEHNNNSFTIDNDEWAMDAAEQPANELIIEELPDEDEEQAVHDQLPSVEEAKANLPHKSAGNSKRLCLLLTSILGVVALTTAVIIFATKSKNDIYQPTGRMGDIVQFLYDNGISTLPDLRDGYTAQHRAAQFISDGDVYQMKITQENSAQFVERYVLALLYYHFEGPEWTHQLKFLDGTDHCDWWKEYSTRSGETIRQGVQCNEDGDVVELNLAWNNLKGNVIPIEIRFLGQLETLHIHYNDIGGYFPEAFQHMPNLKGIGLMRSGLRGTLPEWIGDMTQLTTLGLGDNQFHGEVPASMSNLRSLKILGLDSNNLSGTADVFKSMHELEALYLENNVFSGSFFWTDSWKNLKELDVSNNMIDGPIEASIFNHPNLVVIDINRNLIGGSFPSEIFQNDKLMYLSICSNSIQGTIPDRLAFVSNLKHLDLSFNVLTGTIPDTLEQLTDLRYWATSGNRFSEQKMLDFTKMTNLMDISMKVNNLIGKIPDEIGELTTLQLLDLDGNGLTGSIPSWIGLLFDLDYLLLNRNQLTGTLPETLKNLKSLDVLLLDANSFHGNANVICESETRTPTYFTADCYPGQNGQKPEIDCRCCTECCLDGDFECNDKAWTSNVDPVWIYGYNRPSYTFNLDNAPVLYSKAGDQGDGNSESDSFPDSIP